MTEIKNDLGGPLKKSIAATLAVASIATSIASDKIIYGEDNRLDIFDVREAALLEVAASTAAMIPTWKVGYFQRQNVSSGILSMLSLKGSMNVCSDERFAQQPAIANCSGFLVDEKTIVTAGHCINEIAGCSENYWVFDYNLSSPLNDRISLKPENVYRCARVVRSVLDEMTRNDYAVVELDRPVTGRRPLNFRKTGKVQLEAPLVVIGHPSGLPTKVAGGARVMEYNNDIFFRTNLDTYGGNSGSAVFNAETLEVEGILVRGARDYVESSSGCLRSNVVSVDRATEAVTAITNVLEIQNL